MMKNLIQNCGLVIFLGLSISCSGQGTLKKTGSKPIGGGCEGCEAIYEYGIKTLSWVDTLPDFKKAEPKLKLYGTVYQLDGKTPAPGVILYIYHTGRTGIYEQKGEEKGWGKRHGYFRGWVKTDEMGRYAFYTFRPAAYPDGTEPEHIHLTVKEPNINEYYLDDFLFQDDPKLTQEDREKMPNRGGNGISPLVISKGILQLNRDIILGLNIPDYE